MTLLYIVLVTLTGGILSVLAAAALPVPLLHRLSTGLVSLSAGVLLATALLQVLPEAFDGGTDPHALFLTMLGGLIFFFLLEKAELYRHSHQEDSTHVSQHHPALPHLPLGHGGLSVLLGDCVHNFCDGVIVAAAFLADPQIGLVTSAAIVAHEIPHEVGDFVVLLSMGLSRRRALFYNALAGLAAVIGGCIGYWLVKPWHDLFPYLLVATSSCFLYVAMADLLPRLQRRLSWRDTLSQLGLLAIGPGIVFLLRGLIHTV